jgi:tetratricopeptide (TPR) repeat protein
MVKMLGGLLISVFALFVFSAKGIAAANQSTHLIVSDSLKADSIYKVAISHYEQNDMGAAQQLVSQAIELDGKRADYWKLLMHIQHGQGDVDGTIAILGRLIELEPKERQHYMDRAFLLSYLGEYEESLELYDTLIKELGKDDQVYTALATVYKMMEQNDKAVAELESLIQKGTNLSVAYVMLSELYLEDGNSDKALQMVNEGLSKFPDVPVLLFGKADVLKAKKQVKEALALTEKGFRSKDVDLDYKSGLLYRSMNEGVFDPQQILSLADRFVLDYPNDPRSHAVRGDMYGQVQNYNEARISYLKAVEINRYIPTIWLQMMYLSFMQENWKEAQQTGTRASEIFPNDPDILFYTANSFLMDKNHEEARKYLEAALNNTPMEREDFLVDLYVSLGTVYNSLAMHSASDVAFKEALALDSLNALALNNYAYYLAERNEKLHEAKHMAEKSIQLSPNNSNTLDTYAWILYKLGEYKEALQWIKSAVKHDPNGGSMVVLEHYGDILFQNGKVNDAVKQWKNALKVALEGEEDHGRLSRKVKEKRITE